VWLDPAWAFGAVAKSTEDSDISLFATEPESAFGHKQPPIHSTFFDWLYSPCGPWTLFSFLIYSQSVGFLGRVISSSQGLYLNRKNIHTSNIYALSGIRSHDHGVRADKDSSGLRPLGYSDQLYSINTGDYPPGQSFWELNLTTDLQLGLWLRMRGVIPPPSLGLKCVCLIKKKENFTASCNQYTPLDQ
jgi:hypothetical protein